MPRPSYLPLEPSPHGRPVELLCSRCPATVAAYAGAVPRGWRRDPETGELYCRRCRRALAGRPAAPARAAGAV